MIEASFYNNLTSELTECELCPHHCRLNPGQKGLCGVRKNISGKFYSLNSDLLVAVHNDPIEKKPLYHFLPGSTSLSLASSGCNLRCLFCQNHLLSVIENDSDIYGDRFTPESIIDLALRFGASSISYTYSEPTVFIELFEQLAPLAKKVGLRNVIVSNGFINKQPLQAILPYLDAANIDLKAFNDQFYREQCRGRLQPVLETIKTLFKHKVWTELTTLLIPGLNDRKEEIKQIVDFLLNLSPDMVWHVSRFYPQHKLLDIPPTPEELILETCQQAREAGLHFVYAGNIFSDKFSRTDCPHCKQTLIQRRGYQIKLSALKNGYCQNCSQRIAGFWS